MIKYKCLVSFAIFRQITFRRDTDFMHRGVFYFINKTYHGSYFIQCAPKPKGRFVICVIYKLRKMPNMYILKIFHSGYVKHKKPMSFQSSILRLGKIFLRYQHKLIRQWENFWQRLPSVRNLFSMHLTQALLAHFEILCKLKCKNSSEM